MRPPPSQEPQICVYAQIAGATDRGQATAREHAGSQEQVDATARTTPTISSEIPAPATDGNGSSGNIYQVKRLLGRWKRQYFLLWADGSTGWVSKSDILDQSMMDQFDREYRGFDDGIDILDSRVRHRRRQLRVRWHGRPTAEDCWIDKRLIDPKRHYRSSMMRGSHVSY